MQNFLFFSVDNKAISYDSKKYSFEESKLNLIDSWNKMYQLLLVQAFEAFSEFMKSLYLILLDLGFEFKQPCLKGGSSLPCDKNFKLTVTNIRTEFFRLYPTLEVYDTKNQLGANFKFMLPFIEKLRHIIAHSHGEFKNSEKFIREVLNVNRLFNNGKYDQEFDQYFDSFTRNKNGIVEIAMMPIPQEPNGAFEVWTNRFDMLNNYLMAYTELMQRVFTHEIDKKIKSGSTAD
ncbi:hypothetical protein [Thiomicrorhabdus sp. 6S3-12]|uniref:hypothetical protein n=1 Tax=Thiomicrorhabdus sp. 6S3-12 TaxID=2819681 RepID=UPI001AAC954A|nr:hypothetical protein [Thiomicrorhabdus sp. 6S3-12]MBO1923362.1 hypothetical protein [Thiomicrorhabdus sp. 6S3-12]